MEKKYKEILKSCSKKKDTIEALFGIDKESVIIILSAIALFLVNGVIVFVIDSNSSTDKTASLLLNAICETLLLILVEFIVIFAIFILFFIVEELVVDVPLLLNTKYLPASEEEIKNLPFETQEEFFDFLYSLCRKKFCGKMWMATSKRLWFDIANTTIMYVKVHELKYSELKIPEEMKESLSWCEDWNSFVEELNSEEIIHKSKKRR